MSHELLNSEELEAIRKKMAVKPIARLSEASIEPTPIPLIADDHAGSRAKPEVLRILNGWLPQLVKLVRRAISVPLGVEVADAVTVDGAALRDRVEGTWFRFARGPKKDSAVLVSIGGPIIEYVAARLLGSRNEEPNVEDASRRRSSSHVGRALFSRVGDMALSSLILHWQDQLGARLDPVSAEAEIAEIRRTFFAQEILMCGSVELSAPVPGCLIIAARPQAFLRRTEPGVPAASKSAVEQALGGVPVEVSVELGRASLTMREVYALVPGSFIELSSTADTPLPIRCEGVLKAFGRPVVSNGTVAVEIISLGGNHVV